MDFTHINIFLKLQLTSEHAAPCALLALEVVEDCGGSVALIGSNGVKPRFAANLGIFGFHLGPNSFDFATNIIIVDLLIHERYGKLCTYNVSGIDAESVQQNVVTTAVRPLISESVGFFHTLHTLPNAV